MFEFQESYRNYIEANWILDGFHVFVGCIVLFSLLLIFWGHLQGLYVKIRTWGMKPEKLDEWQLKLIARRFSNELDDLVFYRRISPARADQLRRQLAHRVGLWDMFPRHHKKKSHLENVRCVLHGRADIDKWKLDRLLALERSYVQRLGTALPFPDVSDRGRKPTGKFFATLVERINRRNGHIGG